MTYILGGDSPKKNENKDERYVSIQILGVQVYTGKSLPGMPHSSVWKINF